MKNCNRRLRILFDLYCLDRYFPPVDSGSSKQHLLLDRAGAYAIGKVNFFKLNKPVRRYKHHRMVTEFDIVGHERLGWAKLEEKKGSQVADLYYPNIDMAVEIDTGTEGHKTLKNKIRGYNRSNISKVAFVTSGGANRVELWKNKIRPDIKFVGCKFEDIEELVKIVN